MKPPPTEQDFDLFISYVRRDVNRTVEGRNFDIVAQMKSELERHRRLDLSTGKVRRFRACTDIDDFELDGSFDEVMRRRIAGSKALLLLCSPGVPASKHVQHELTIERGLLGRPKPLAAVLGSSPAELAPDLFAPTDVAADLQAPDGTTIRDWQNLLRRESHKIVARAWGVPTKEVFDRFEEDRRRLRRRIAVAVWGVVVLALGLTVGLAGDYGMHRVSVLPIAGKLVAPAGVAFAADRRTPVVVKGDKALIWSNGLDTPPAEVRLPFTAIRATAAGPGAIVLGGLKEAALISMPAGGVTHRAPIEGKVEAVAAASDTLVVSTATGDLLQVDARGEAHAGPRPASVAGRRFSAFRETGPVKYGSLLALGGERWLASATMEGRLMILDRQRGSFVVPPEPQFELAPPVEPGADPVLYETENTRPIGAIVFLGEGQLLFAEGAGLRRVDLSTGRITVLEHCPIELVRQLHVLPDGRTVVALTSSTIEVLRLSPAPSPRVDCRQRTTLAPKSAPRAALAPDGRTLLIAYFDGAPELWRPTFRLFGFDLLE